MCGLIYYKFNSAYAFVVYKLKTKVKDICVWQIIISLL